MTRSSKDNIIKGLIYASAGFTVMILVIIIGFILVKGLPGISLSFLTNQYENNTTYISSGVFVNAAADSREDYIPELGVSLAYDKEDGVTVASIDGGSPAKKAIDGLGDIVPIKKGYGLLKVGSYTVESAEEAGGEEALFQKIKEEVKAQGQTVPLKIVNYGGGIFPMIMTTLYMIVLSLLIAAPVGILSAVYLNEYARKGKLLRIIHFAIENLAGIPSIIYGLFGSLFFVKFCGMQYSILAGALTVSIILLPVIISTTEETLKAIPKTYRESSLALGATKFQTVYKIILPNALSGIIVAVLLSIGRIVGESAALLLTAGTVAAIPSALTGNAASGATLTTKAYMLMKEENDLTTACAIGIVLLILIFFLNFASKWVARKAIKTR